jgi:hypothetical protein
MNWNTLSLMYDRETRGLHPTEKKGEALIPIFLDNLLSDCCSVEVQEVFDRALKKFYKVEKE